MSIDDVRKRAKKIADSFGRVAKIKGGHAKDAEQLELALEQLPADDAYAAARAEIQEKAQDWISSVRQNQTKTLKTYLADYIGKARGAGEDVRETGKGWRVGRLELETKPSSACCRVLYSGEEVAGWRDIRSADDLTRLDRDGREKLKRMEIDEKLLPDVMWEAYAARRPLAGRANRVKLLDFFEELRVVLIRREVKGAAHKRIKFAEFPRWAALYNMDRYLALASKVSEDRRLIPETGSQSDVQRGLGCLLGGLSPQVTPMNYCYIHSLH